MKPRILYHNYPVVISGDVIIKVTKEDAFYYEGIDIISEQYVSVSKMRGAIPLPKAVVRLLGDTYLRTQLAMAICKDRPHACRVLNITERTFFRHAVQIGKGRIQPKLD